MLISNNFSNYNVSYGKHSVATAKKALNNVSQTQQVAKKSVGFVSFLATLFGLKKANDTLQQNNDAKLKNGFHEQKVYDKNGNLTNILKYSNADDVLSINITYDTNSGNIKQKDWYKKDGLAKQYSEKYDASGNKSQAIYYSYNGTKPRYIEDYGKKKDIPYEVTYFDGKGNVSEQVYVNDTLDKITDRFTFNDKGHMIKHVKMSAFTDNPLSKTTYYDNGDKLVEEYDNVLESPSAQYLYNKNNQLLDFHVNDNSSDKLRLYLGDKKNTEESIYNIVKHKDKKVLDFLQNRFNMEQSE